MKNNEIKLDPIRKWIINAAFNFLHKQVKRIRNDVARELILPTLQPIEDVIDVITDRVPDNKIQLKELFEEKGGEYICDLIEGIKKIIEGSEKLNDETKELIVTGLNAISNQVKVYL